MATALLVQPPPVTRNKGGALAEPIGLEYIAAMLRSQGHQVVICDAWIDKASFAEIGAEVRSLRPDFVGITATSVLIPNAWRVAEVVKSVDARIPVVIGGAHASCFTMALSFKLAEAGHSDGSVETDAEVTLEKVDDGFVVTRSALSTRGKVPGLDQAKFEELAADAKANCPISKLLDAEITLETSFAN